MLKKFSLRTGGVADPPRSVRTMAATRSSKAMNYLSQFIRWLNGKGKNSYQEPISLISAQNNKLPSTDDQGPTDRIS